METMETTAKAGNYKLPKQFVYFFSAEKTDGNTSMRSTLGGKGAN